MADDDGKALTIPWAPLLALLAAVAGVAALLPSQSARPTAESDTASLNQVSGVSARLWEDPISVARQAARSPEKTAAPDVPSLAGLVQAYQDLARNGSPPLVLVACEPNSPYAEDVERRVRDRAAVMYALAEEGYLPKNSMLLLYALVDEQADVLPYEIFRHLNVTGNKSAVLVIWLPDGVLSPDGPLCQLALLAQHLAAGSENQPGGPAPRIRVLGPSTSDQYGLMLKSAADYSRTCPGLEQLAATRIYSCKVSSPEAAFLNTSPWVKEAAAALGHQKLTEIALTNRLRSAAGGAAKFRLLRTICPDDQLAALLWQELALRNIPAKAHVAALAELDSFYGRTTVAAFLGARPGADPAVLELDLAAARAAAPNVHVYTYMAGLDGALPKTDTGGEEVKSTKKADSAAKPDSSTDDPVEGLSQIDYLRRLAGALQRRDQQLRARNRELNAVAVLGSDIYDKLQILRTIRPELPRALFLTNNLDARFGHPDEWEETRNLLVAANYDLAPRKEWKSESPPFRDSMQAAVYAAARLALKGGKEHSIWMGRPLLFEIGQSGPVRLRLPAQAKADVSAVAAPVPAGRKHPPLALGTLCKALCCLSLTATLAGLLWAEPSPRQVTGKQPAAERFEPHAPGRLHQWVNTFLDAESGWRETLFKSGVMIPLLVLLSLAVTVIRYGVQPAAGKEPFAWLDGISIWPGDFLRLCVLLLSAHFATKIVHRLRRNARFLETRLPIVAPGDELPLYDVAGSGWRCWWRNFWPRAEDYADATERVDVRVWWLRYKAWTNSLFRLGRAGVLLVLGFGGLMCFLGVFNQPYTHVLPVRGSAAWFSTLILWTSGLGAMYVSFLVVDATDLNWRWIHDLNRARSNWHLEDVDQRLLRKRVLSYWSLLEHQDCADYLDIELIASRSEAVNGLVYYPFILLTLTILSRWRMTDNYQWGTALLLGLGANLAVAVYCAIRLPIEAQQARQKCLQRLRGKLFERRVAEGRKKEFERSSVSALEQVIKQIETMNRGAFVGIWEQPVLRAVLVPSGGAGVWALLGLLPH